MASSSCSRSQASLLLKRWRTSSPHCRIPPHPPPPTPVHHGAVTASVTFTPPVQRRFMSDHSSATGMRPSGKILYLQVILFEIDFAIFYTNLHELFRQFISWTNWVNTGKFMNNCWISCQVMADMEIVYNDLIIINL